MLQEICVEALSSPWFRRPECFQKANCDFRFLGHSLETLPCSADRFDGSWACSLLHNIQGTEGIELVLTSAKYSAREHNSPVDAREAVVGVPCSASSALLWNPTGMAKGYRNSDEVQRGSLLVNGLCLFFSRVADFVIGNTFVEDRPPFTPWLTARAWVICGPCGAWP